MEVRIRNGILEDLPVLTGIYNHYVIHTPATFDIEPFTIEQRREWFDHYSESGPYRLLVADTEGTPVGYATSSPLRARAAYHTSIETSVFVDKDALGHGIGRKLYTALFEELAKTDLHRAYAGIALPNSASVDLHQRFGFKQTGIFHEVGKKFGQYHSVAWFEKVLND